MLSRYRLVVCCTLLPLAVPATISAQSVPIEVAQESSPDAGDFDSNVLGTIWTDDEPRDVVAKYDGDILIGLSPRPSSYPAHPRARTACRSRATPYSSARRCSRRASASTSWGARRCSCC